MQMFKRFQTAARLLCVADNHSEAEDSRSLSRWENLSVTVCEDLWRGVSMTLEFIPHYLLGKEASRTGVRYLERWDVTDEMHFA